MPTAVGHTISISSIWSFLCKFPQIPASNSRLAKASSSIRTTRPSQCKRCILIRCTTSISLRHIYGRKACVLSCKSSWSFHSLMEQVCVSSVFYENCLRKILKMFLNFFNFLVWKLHSCGTVLSHWMTVFKQNPNCRFLGQQNFICANVWEDKFKFENPRRNPQILVAPHLALTE